MYARVKVGVFDFWLSQLVFMNCKCTRMGNNVFGARCCVCYHLCCFVCCSVKGSIAGICSPHFRIFWNFSDHFTAPMFSTCAFVQLSTAQYMWRHIHLISLPCIHASLTYVVCTVFEPCHVTDCANRLMHNTSVALWHWVNIRMYCIDMVHDSMWISVCFNTFSSLQVMSV